MTQTNPHIAPTLDADGQAWLEYEIETKVMAALVAAQQPQPDVALTAEDRAQMKRERRLLLVRDHAKHAANGVAASMPKAPPAVIAAVVWAQAEALADTDPLNAFET